MIMSKLLFWDVDTQVDFMEPGGRLYVPGAENIAFRIRKLTQFAAEHRIPIVASMCAHLPDDPEFAEYPAHCLVGTPGQKKISGTLLESHFVVPNRRIELPNDIGSFQQTIIEKQATNVFTNPNTDNLLEQLRGTWDNVPPSSVEIVLYGVVTEICVDLAARGLIDRGYRVKLLSDSIRHLSPERGQATIGFVREHGGAIATSEEIFSAFAART
jgi:nicotinamidase/pyrazinamidase